MARLLLVKPDYGFGIEICPPLGLCQLAASARLAGHEVRVLDLRLPGQQETEFDSALSRWRPDVVGFSALSYEAPAVHRLAQNARRSLPHATILVGGPLASADPEEALSSGHVDYALLGESDQRLVHLLEGLGTGGLPEDLDGVAYRSDGSLVLRPIERYIEDLDALPFPAWDLLDMDAYSRMPRLGFIYKEKRYFPVFTSRGCPYRCIYCHNIFGKRFRPRSAANVLAELERLVEDYGIREIHFIDDVFNFRADRAGDILQGIVDRGWNLALSFPSGVRTDLLDEPLIDLMHRAGTYKVCCAIETGTPRLQRVIRKNLKIEKARENIARLAKRGIFTHTFFMTGFPTETPEDVQATIDFAMPLESHTASFFITNPFKGTQLAEMLAVEGKPDASSLGASNYFDPRVADLRVSEVPPDRLRKMVSRATREFYLKHPRRLWRILRDVPRKRQLLFLAFLTFNRAFAPRAIRLERRLLLGRRQSGRDRARPSDHAPPRPGRLPDRIA